MKRILLSAALLFASPVAAYEVADTAECQAVWDSFLGMVPIVFDDSAPPEKIVVTATDDGWCQMTGGETGLENATFETLAFRIDGINAMILNDIPPSAIALRVRNVMTEGDPPRRLSQVDVALTHFQDRQTLLLENLELVDEAGGRLQVTGVFAHLDLASRGRMMMSIGGVSLSQLAGVLEVVGGVDLLGARGEPRADQDMFLSGLAAVPETVISATSKDALARFLAPDRPDGTLLFSLSSERGIGLLQSIMGRFVHDTETPEGFAKALELVLDGVTLDVVWQSDVTIEQ